MQRLLAEGTVPAGSMKEVFVHMIADDALMNQLSVATKLVALPAILNALKSAGQEAAERFLETHGDRLNRQGVGRSAGDVRLKRAPKREPRRPREARA